MSRLAHPRLFQVFCFMSASSTFRWTSILLDVFMKWYLATMRPSIGSNISVLVKAETQAAEVYVHICVEGKAMDHNGISRDGLRR